MDALRTEGFCFSIDKTHRGVISVSNIVIEKSIRYALKSFANQIKILDVNPFIVDNDYLHAELSIKVIKKNLDISILIRDINQIIKDGLFSTLGVKPKNVAIFLSTN